MIISPVESIENVKFVKMPRSRVFKNAEAIIVNGKLFARLSSPTSRQESTEKAWRQGDFIIMTRQRQELNPRMTTAEAASYLGYQPATLRSWRLRGGGPDYEQPHGPRGKTLYWKSDLDKWKKMNNGGVS